MTRDNRGRKPKAEEQSDSRFGSLVRQHFRRKNISNQLLANETLLDPTLISKMLKGQRTNRANVLAVIAGLIKLGVLDSLAEANALLAAVPGLAALDARLPEEANLIKLLSQSPTPHVQVSPYFAPTRTNLPQPPNRLIGREQQIKEVKALLTQEPNRLVTISGIGGVGKTRLALEVATALVPNFEAGVYLIALENVTESLSLIAKINATLRVSEIPGKTPLAGLINFLQTKDLLLVLDNFEQLVDHAVILADLLRATAKLKILVTSRESLRLSFEWQYPLMPLDLPEEKDLDYQNLLNYAVVNLFAERAKAVKPDFNLSIHNIAGVVEICQRLDGLPLAIELAAARIKVFEVESLYNRLNLKFLSSGFRDLPQRHQNLIATIAWSYELLGADEKTVYRCLGMFDNANLEALEAVCGGQVEDLEQICQALVDKSLIKVAAGRYFMLHTIREYALEQLQNRVEQVEWYKRFEVYFEDLAKDYNKRLEKDNSTTVLELIELDYNNLETVLHRHLQLGEVQRFFQLCITLNEYWHLKGYWSEGRAYMEQALALVTDKAPKAELLLLIADFALMQGDYNLAEEQAKNSFALWSELGDWQGLKLILITLGNVTCAKGNFDLAKNHLHESLKLCRETDDRVHTAKNLNTLGLIALQQGDYQLAKTYLEEGLSLARAGNRKSTISVSLSYLGMLAQFQGQNHLAQMYYEEKFAIEQEFANRRGIGSVLASLGRVAYEQADYELAQKYFKESLVIRREIGNNGEIANCLNGLGNVAHSQKEYYLAQFYYEEALKLYQENGLNRGVLNSLLGLANTTLSQQNGSQTASLCGTIANLVREMNIVLSPAETKNFNELIEGTRQLLGEARYKEFFEQGEQIDLQLYVKEIFQNPARQAYSPISGSPLFSEVNPKSEKRIKLI
jgi:predicted ATPase/Tfp pilus assembly protein PilF